MSNARTLAGLIDGSNIVVPSGYGIDFTSSSDSTATDVTVGNEVLSDYEEGTWTPYLYGHTTAGTFSASIQTGVYRKVGSLLYLFFDIKASVLSGHSGRIRIGGFPFSTTNGSGYVTYVEGGDFGYTSSTGNETLFIEPALDYGQFKPQNQNTAYDKFALTVTYGTINLYMRGSILCYL